MENRWCPETQKVNRFLRYRREAFEQVFKCSIDRARVGSRWILHDVHFRKKTKATAAEEATKEIQKVVNERPPIRNRNRYRKRCSRFRRCGLKKNIILNSRN